MKLNTKPGLFFFTTKSTENIKYFLVKLSALESLW